MSSGTSIHPFHEVDISPLFTWPRPNHSRKLYCRWLIQDWGESRGNWVIFAEFAGVGNSPSSNPAASTGLSILRLHQTVHILGGSKGDEEGYLLPGKSVFSMFNQVFRTRKLRFKSSLAPGTSGSWVVRDGRLCGYIVAVYGQEPFAHIITAEKAFSDIRATFRWHGQGPQTLRVATTDDIEELSKGESSS